MVSEKGCALGHLTRGQFIGERESLKFASLFPLSTPPFSSSRFGRGTFGQKLVMR